LQENFLRALDEAGIYGHDIFFDDSWIMTPEVICDGKIAEHQLKLPKDRVSLLFNLAWSISAPYVGCALTKFGKPDDPKIVDKWSSVGGWKDACRYWLDRQDVHKTF
jgi:hypothetical protein